MQSEYISLIEISQGIRALDEEIMAALEARAEVSRPVNLEQA